MGLGPHGSALLERLGRPQAPGEDTLWIQIDQEARGEARHLARLRHQNKNKKTQKPLAPATQLRRQETFEGVKEWLWYWDGEDIPSKGLHHGLTYYTSYIRERGFRIPKLQKPEKKAKGKKHE